MDKAHIGIGTEFVFREKPGAPLERVKILAHVRGDKWKVQWIEPNAGLVDFVKSGQLVVRWGERRAWEKDDEHERQLREHNKRLGYEEDSPIGRAMYEIFESVGDGDVSFYRGCLSGKTEALERLKVRVGFDMQRVWPYSYVDRHGTPHHAFDEAFELAKAFCATEPATVLAGVEATERKWSLEYRQPGEEHMVSLLNDYRASWALIRQWAGHDAAVAQREAEIQRLERLVWDAVYALQKAGLDAEAGRLRRAIERR